MRNVDGLWSFGHRGVYGALVSTGGYLRWAGIGIWCGQSVGGYHAIEFGGLCGAEEGRKGKRPMAEVVRLSGSCLRRW